MEKDPLVKQLKTHPDFKKNMDKLKEKFWVRHKNVRASLEEKQLI